MSEDEENILNTTPEEEMSLQLFIHSSSKKLNLRKYETQGKLGLTKGK